MITSLLPYTYMAATYYMASNGDNANDGLSTNAPWQTLTKAGGAMRAGDALFIRGGFYDVNHQSTNGGTYQYFSPGYFTANGGAAGQGTQANPIVVSNYPGEVPIFANGNLDSTGVAPFTLGANAWIKIFGLTLTNCNINSITLPTSCTNMEIAYCTMGPSSTNKRGAVFYYGDLCFSNYIHDNTIFGAWSSEQVGADGRQGESGDVVSFGPTAWQTITPSNSAFNVFSRNIIYQGGHSGFNPQGSMHDYYVNNFVHNEVWINWPDYHQLGGHRAAGAFGGWSVYEGNTFAYAGNPIANDGAEGLGIFGQYNIVRHNRIHHNENFGLTLYDKAVGDWHPNTNHVYNNTFAHNALGQMSMTNYYTNVITDLSGDKTVMFFSGATNNVVINNIFAFNGGHLGTNNIEHRGVPASSDTNALSYTNWFNNLSGDPLFVLDSNDLYYWGHLLGDPFNQSNPNYQLQVSSPCIDSGGWLTTTTSSSSGTSMPVADSWFFWEGTTAAGTVFPGDTIQLQGQTTTSTITAIDRSTHTLTLSTPLTWTNGQGVSLPYSGSAPDMGAFEFTGHANVMSGGSVLRNAVLQ